MPSTAKTLHFISSALITAISVGLMGYAMSKQWARTTIQCARGGSGLFNGTAILTLELFSGNLERTSCPSFGGDERFNVFPKLTETGVTPLALYSMVLCLLVLCLLFSACSILICLYNSVSNPYETYMGPVGVYTCSSLSACLSVLALIIFVVNINVTSMAEDLVKNFAGGLLVDLKNKSSEMQLGYYLIIPYTVLCLGAIGVTYNYDHAAYKQRKEQQRPTEDAPKEIMMY
ncbi:clarin-3 [Lates calcarifer]|uniref:Clarin-3 n=1 Tax=Lates calcarifer TaxID=8187 RepID=A0A4W6FDX1_LATCA|nr:clarin-3 [Lates calcarifer]XP_018554702.1 clarin-3 [Lates calcarifer]